VAGLARAHAQARSSPGCGCSWQGVWRLVAPRASGEARQLRAVVEQQLAGLPARGRHHLV